ncbi:MAG: helix-turn-helix domain-containing protein [Anaerolineales bacterium]|nr:helix-turn-helix domain-containing protein [Anaerolineales bacterium]
MTEQVGEAPNRLTLLTAREAAVYLRVSLSTLRRMERQGRLTPLRTPGGHRRFSLEQLNACLSQPPGRPEMGAA